MLSPFLHYIQKTYPRDKCYAVAALQDAASMLKKDDVEIQKVLAAYFKMDAQAWQILRTLLIEKEDHRSRCIRVCRGPVCHNQGSMKILLETSVYIEKEHPEYMLKEIHCQGECHQAPIVFVNDKIFVKCRVENLFLSIK